MDQKAIFVSSFGTYRAQDIAAQVNALYAAGYVATYVGPRDYPMDLARDGVFLYFMKENPPYVELSSPTWEEKIFLAQREIETIQRWWRDTPPPPQIIHAPPLTRWQHLKEAFKWHTSTK